MIFVIYETVVYLVISQSLRFVMYGVSYGSIIFVLIMLTF